MNFFHTGMRRRKYKLGQTNLDFGSKIMFSLSVLSLSLSVDCLFFLKNNPRAPERRGVLTGGRDPKRGRIHALSQKPESPALRTSVCDAARTLRIGGGEGRPAA